MAVGLVRTIGARRLGKAAGGDGISPACSIMAFARSGMAFWPLVTPQKLYILGPASAEESQRPERPASRGGWRAYSHRRPNWEFSVDSTERFVSLGCLALNWDRERGTCRGKTKPWASQLMRCRRRSAPSDIANWQTRPF